MRNWHSLYEILKFPLEMIFLACMMLGVGNLLTNDIYTAYFSFDSEIVMAVGQILHRLGQFLIVNFPLIILCRFVARRAGSSVTVISALAGYVAFLVTTMFTAPANLGSSAYSSIFGLSVTTAGSSSLTSTVRYPLQTGVLAVVIVTVITLISYRRARNRNEYGFFSFASKESVVAVRTVFFSILAGFLVSLVWKYVLMAVNKLITFISVDTTNPINLALFGAADRLLSVLNLSTLIRSPFWYGSNGGSWINVAGTAVTGDVSIWSAQLNANAITSMTGRFITPYYILNIFAMPAVLIAFHTLITDPMERRRKRLLMILSVLAAMLFGTLLPMELMMVLLCPLLFFFHLGMTAMLFALLQSLHIYLGYAAAGTNTLSAQPGTLPELLLYISQPGMEKTLIYIACIGVVMFLVYFFATRFYFRHLAVDLFQTGETDRMVSGTIKAVGGVENIKMLQSNTSELTVSVYDPQRINAARLKKLGSCRVYETRAGFNICFGAASTMIHLGMKKAMRDSIRSVNES